MNERWVYIKGRGPVKIKNTSQYMNDLIRDESNLKLNHKFKYKNLKQKTDDLYEKYKDYVSRIIYYRNRDWATSGPNTGKGSKGTKYIYTFSTSIANKGDKGLRESLFENSLEDLENKIKDRINKYKNE